MLSGIGQKQHLQDIGVSYNSSNLLMLSGIGQKQHLHYMGQTADAVLHELDCCFPHKGRNNT